MLNDNNLQTRPQHGCPINFDNSNKLIKYMVHGNTTHKEALKKMADISYNFTKITTEKKS